MAADGILGVPQVELPLLDDYVAEVESNALAFIEGEVRMLGTQNNVQINYRFDFRRRLGCYYIRASLFSLLFLLSACRTAQISDRRELGVQPTAKPAMIHVLDFDLDAQNIESEPGLLPQPGTLLPRRGILSELTGRSENPADRACELVDRMSNSLVKDLIDAGISARRLMPGEPLPLKGWLVRGVFTEVQEGNRLRRAVIGFGIGKTELQVLVCVDDLEDGMPKPFYEFDTSADSGNRPGGGEYAAGVKYVMGRFDLDKNVVQTASAIAADIGQRIRNQPTAPN